MRSALRCDPEHESAGDMRVKLSLAQFNIQVAALVLDALCFLTLDELRIMSGFSKLALRFWLAIWPNRATGRPAPSLLILWETIVSRETKLFDRFHFPSLVSHCAGADGKVCRDDQIESAAPRTQRTALLSGKREQKERKKFSLFVADFDFV